MQTKQFISQNALQSLILWDDVKGVGGVILFLFQGGTIICIIQKQKFKKRAGVFVEPNYIPSDYELVIWFLYPIITELPQCPSLENPLHGGLVCVTDKTTKDQYCQKRCDPGYEHATAFKDYSQCGPSTDYVWTEDIDTNCIGKIIYI